MFQFDWLIQNKYGTNNLELVTERGTFLKKTKKAHLSMSFFFSSGEQDRTADLRVMNPAL